MPTVIEPEEISTLNKPEDRDILNAPKVDSEIIEEEIIPTDEEIEVLQKQQISSQQALSIQNQKKKNVKRKIWIIVVAAILLLSLILLGFYFAKNLFTSSKNSSTTTSSGQAGSFSLIKESGEVFFKDSLSSYTQLDADEKSLPNESFVKVGTGLAHVLFANNSLLSIDSNSEIQIKTDAGGVSVNQLAGNTWNRVKKLAANERYTVQTPSALATVKGTKFGVELSKKNPRDISGFYTVEGIVNVGQLGKDNQEVTKDEVVSPGFIEVKPIGQENSISKGNLLGEDIQGRWYMRNRVIDKLFDARIRIDLQDFIKNIRSSNDLQRINSDNKSNTKKENCLELLDQTNIIKQEAGNIKISSPKDTSEFKPTETISFTSSSIDPCTTKPFDSTKIRWYLNTSIVAFGTGSTVQQKDLVPGDYNVTVKVTVAGKELTDSIRFKILGASSSSSSSSKITGNQSPVVTISNPTNGGTYPASSQINPSIYRYDFPLSITATDPEDGILSGKNITWTAASIAPNSQGNGENLKASCNHDTSGGKASTPCTISVTATDSKGLATKITITINVSPSAG